MKRVALFYDLDNWILGTTAKQIVRCLNTDFAFHLCSVESIYRNPLRELRILANCDLIHWISSYGYLHFGPLFTSKPQICTLHHLENDVTLRVSQFRGVRILTLSEQSRQALFKYGFREIEIIPYGVTDEFLQPPLNQQKAREHLRLPEGALIGFFGKASSNFEDRKGTKILVDVLIQLNQTERVGLLLSGAGWNDLIEQLNIADIPVHYRPALNLDEMRYNYAAIDIYTCLSRLEGGPIPVLEAMACERAVISTPVGHVPEAITHGYNGLIVPIGDIPVTLREIRSVLHDPILAQRMGNAARQTILQNWTWDTRLSPLRLIYNSVIKENINLSVTNIAKHSALIVLLLRSAKHKIRRA